MSIRKSGINALLTAGIANYSFKVERWEKARTNVENEQMKYYSVGEIADVLKACRTTVRHLLATGRMKYYRKRRSYYVTADEVRRFMKSLGQTCAELVRESHCAPVL